MEDSSEIFNYSSKTGHKFTTLNIGGGFSGYRSQNKDFLKVAQEVSKLLEEFTSKHGNIRVIAEPG